MISGCVNLMCYFRCVKCGESHRSDLDDKWLKKRMVVAMMMGGFGGHGRDKVVGKAEMS